MNAPGRHFQIDPHHMHVDPERVCAAEIIVRCWTGDRHEHEQDEARQSASRVHDCLMSAKKRGTNVRSQMGSSDRAC